MSEVDSHVGSVITLAELKGLGRFVRWQDLDARVAELVAKGRLPQGYPVMPSRLPGDVIDLWIGEHWKQVRFVRIQGSRSSGDRQVVYEEGGQEKTTRYRWYGVAPAGHFTEWAGDRPRTLADAALLPEFELAQQGHVIHSQSLQSDAWPYLTFKVESYHPGARWVDREDMWGASYTIHAADPRVRVEGVVPRESWFNTTIAVSHRWLSPDHPDPDGTQYRELLALSEKLGLHDSQSFLIDYCSLPQHPRDPEQAAWFTEHLPGFQEQFKYVTLVLNTGSADYATRAWCMFELMLAAMSRAKQPTLLNHDQLDEPLRGAKELAESYVKQAGWNEDGMASAFRQGLTNASFAQWARDPMNVALYNASIDNKRAIFDKFENELAVTDPNDRPLIISLLEKLTA